MSNGQFRTPLPANEPIKAYGPGSPEKIALKAELERQRKNPIEIPVVIGGKRIFSPETQQITAPHNKSLVLAKAHQASRDDVNAAIKTAVEMRREWGSMPWKSRAAVFLKAADLITTKYRAKINAATMLGQSKTVYQAEIDSACEVIDFFKFNAHFMEQIYEVQPFSPNGQWNQLEARGLEGFVYAVTPFNFTAISLNLPCAPALMGCTAVWKPATTALLAAYIGLEILEEAGLPPGVINMIPGDAPMITDIVMTHPEFAGLHFTGSTGTFNKLWQKAGENLNKYKSYPRIVGETGGKDFVFAHESADVEAVAVALVRAGFEYQGQKCSAASRAYIPKSMWPKLKERLIALTSEIKMGDVEDFKNFMSAVIDKPSFDRIKNYIEQAKSDSAAKIIFGGNCDDSVGYFIQPTIIEVSDPNYRTMKEEIFGPVLSVYVYEENKFEETLKLCDEGSVYALTGAIFARDRRTVDYMAKRLEFAAGNFYINDKPTGATVGQQPFGGARGSGTNDKAGSMFNLLRWVSHRTVKETFVSPTEVAYPFMAES